MVPFLIITVAGIALGLIFKGLLPWWLSVAIAFLAGLVFARKGWKSLLAGLGAGLLIWLVPAYLIHLDVGGDFTGKVADLLQPDWGAGRLILLTGLLGALLTSLSTWSGFLIKTAFRPTARRSRRFY